MSTHDEIAAKMADMQKKMDKRILRMEKLIDEKMKLISERVVRENRTKQFNEGEKVNGFVWAYEYAGVPHECIASGRTLLPLTKAYRGVKNLTIELSSVDIDMATYPQVYWLSKEEFTIAKLKGQI